jgi:hypothetical protein
MVDKQLIEVCGDLERIIAKNHVKLIYCPYYVLPLFPYLAKIS